MVLYCSENTSRPINTLSARETPDYWTSNKFNNFNTLLYTSMLYYMRMGLKCLKLST